MQHIIPLEEHKQDQVHTHTTENIPARGKYTKDEKNKIQQHHTHQILIR